MAFSFRLDYFLFCFERDILLLAHAKFNILLNEQKNNTEK